MDRVQRTERDRAAADVASASARDARCRVLALLVPPLVHRLNNLMMVVAAGVDVAAAGLDGRRIGATRDDARRLLELLARLSSFARDHAPTHGPFDLCASLAQVEQLLRPLAESRGVELELRARLSSAHVEGDGPRLEQALAAELGETLAGLGAPHGARRAHPDAQGPRPRLRLTISGSGRRIRVGWAYVTLPAGDGGATEAGRGETPLAREVGALAAEAGARARRRALGRTRAAAVVFTGVTVPREAEAEGRPRDGAKILLIEPVSHLGELIQAVLTEAGHEVVVARGTAEARRLLATPCALVLVDTEIEFETPAFLRELEQLPGLGARIALLEGRPEREGTRLLPTLKKPFRPGQLLDFVRGLAR